MNDQLVKILGDLAVALSPLLMALIGLLVNAINKKLKASTQNDLVKGGLVKLDNMVYAVITELNQTVVNELKKGLADGKWTDAEKRAVKQAAMDKLKSFISMEQLSKLLGFGSALVAEEFISTKVESAVGAIKSDPLA